MHSYILFRKTEVCNSNVPFRIEKDIFWFEISVDNPVNMEAPESMNYFSGVDFGSSLVELLLLTQVGKQLSSIQEINHEIKLSFCLECKMQSYDVWIFNFF